MIKMQMIYWKIRFFIFCDDVQLLYFLLNNTNLNLKNSFNLFFMGLDKTQKFYAKRYYVIIF